MKTGQEPESDPIFILVASPDGFPTPVGVWDETMQDHDPDQIDLIRQHAVNTHHVHDSTLHVLRIDLPVDTLKKLVFPRIDASKCELTHDDGLD